MLTKDRLIEILDKMHNVRVGIIGDGALDIYWVADMTRSELSRETPHFPLPVVKERYSGGGCANVAANVSALQPAFVTIITMIGNDWRGRLFIKTLAENNIKTDDLVISDEKVTPAYCKPIRKGISDVEYEDPRLDFQNYSELTPEEESRVITNLENVSGQVDVIVVVDQILYGIVTEKVRKKLSEITNSGIPVIVDSRDRIGLYSGVIVKPNETEACRVIDRDINPRKINENLICQAAKEINKRNNCPTIVTMGSRGALWVDDEVITKIPTISAEPPIDICGAGDTFLSAFSCAFKAGASGPEAISIANLASGVTVKKIGTTGTATREEIIDKFEETARRWPIISK
jgi:rfaE bifunctional protein kinase chain/domain